MYIRLVSLFVEYIYVIEVAGEAVDVEAIADDEFLGDFKADEVRFQFEVLQGFGLEEKGRDAYGGGIERAELGKEFHHCVAGVDDVLHENYMAVLEVFTESHHLFDHACAARAFIAFEADECQFGVDVLTGAEKVDGKGRGTVEHTHEEWLFVSEICGYDFGELGDAGVDAGVVDIGAKFHPLIAFLFHGLRAEKFLPAKLRKKSVIQLTSCYENGICQIWLLYSQKLISYSMKSVYNPFALGRTRDFDRICIVA